MSVLVSRNHCQYGRLKGHNLKVFNPLTQKLNHLAQHNKQHHRKVLLSSFHLNGHTLKISSTDSKLEQLCTEAKGTYAYI